MRYVTLLVLFAGCGEATIGFGSWTITGGSGDDGHPAVGRVFVAGSARCGGTLVGKSTVLTSAHCIGDGDDMLTFELDDGTSIQVVAAQKHPDYEGSGGEWNWGNGLFHDIAVLDLSDVAPITPLRTYAQPPERSMPISLVGFGATQCSVDDASPADAEPLCQGDGVKRVATNTIEQLYANEFTIKGTGNACKGDSGGAVLTKIGGVEVVIGMPARGEMPCGQRSYATRIDVHLEWLQQTAKDTVEVLDPGQPDTFTPVGDASSNHDAADALNDGASDGADDGSDALSGGCDCEVSPSPGGSAVLLLLLCAAAGRRRR